MYAQVCTLPHLPTLTLCLELSEEDLDSVPPCLSSWGEPLSFSQPSLAAFALASPLSHWDFFLLLFFALLNYWNTVTFLKSSRWKIQAPPTLPIPAPPYRTLLVSSLFSKKAFGAGKFRPSSAPQGFVFCEDLSQRALKVLGDPWLGLEWFVFSSSPLHRLLQAHARLRSTVYLLLFIPLC